jgi:hypothetical protein
LLLLLRVACCSEIRRMWQWSDCESTDAFA